MTESKETLTVEQSPLLNGNVVQFGFAGSWFYTADVPEDAEDMFTALDFTWKSPNFPSKEEAVAYGRGFEEMRSNVQKAIEPPYNE